MLHIPQPSIYKHFFQHKLSSIPCVCVIVCVHLKIFSIFPESPHFYECSSNSYLLLYAIRKKYIEENLADKIVISVKFRQVVKKTWKTETYNSDEFADFNKYLDSMYAETEDTVYLAVKLNFMIGLRVGELVALRWSDWTDINHLHIMREEIRNQNTVRSTYHRKADSVCVGKICRTSWSANKIHSKMRKTYASRLNANGVPLDAIREQRTK